ncbi:MAG: hypothetical protein H6538_04395 [Bacteroidales bacterium]|nr:hypothetical protein [Bacteroidales bacterium]MCB9013296.1 hypothetical protein [Bacteroidales bacterium]
MNLIEPIDYEGFYHIYNRGINSCDIFHENTNYEYFIRLYKRHICPIAETYAWVLMKNHFHFLVRIKKMQEILTQKEKQKLSLSDFAKPHQHFSNLFNAYSKAFNKRYKRHGSLFERPFKRKLIKDMNYFNQVLTYIHNNPVHHGFADHPMDYPWSSFLFGFSEIPIKQIDDIPEMSGEERKMNLKEIEEFLGLI